MTSQHKRSCSKLSKAPVMCKVIEATFLYQMLSSIGNLLWFSAKNWVKILIVPTFQLKFDDVNVTLSLIVLSSIFLKTHLDTILLIPKFVKIECHLHGYENRSTFAQWGWGGVLLPPLAPSLRLILGPRR